MISRGVGGNGDLHVILLGRSESSINGKVDS